MTSVNNFPFHLAYDYKRANTLFADQFLKVYFEDSLSSSELLLSNLYKLKYQISFLLDQYNQIEKRLGSRISKLFVLFWLKRRYKFLIEHTLKNLAGNLTDLTSSD